MIGRKDREMKIREMLIISFVVSLVFPIPIAAETPNETSSSVRLPAGWRLPSASEVDQSWRSSDTTKYLTVAGNFDGTGKANVAFLLVKSDRTGFAPFIALNQGSKEPKLFQVEETNAMEYLAAEGLKLAKPGTYVTACGKGYDCGPNEEKSIKLSFDGLEFFKEEGSSRLIYFDPNTRRFKESWLSD